MLKEPRQKLTLSATYRERFQDFSSSIMIWWRVVSCGAGSNYTDDHLFILWGGLEMPITVNVKVGVAYEKMLKILPTSYLEPFKIPPTENPING